MPFTSVPAAAETTAGLREQKKAAAREAVIDAALDLFAERGFEHTTVADIAARARVSPASIARYFPSKESLIFTERDERAPALRAAIVARPREEAPYRAVLAALHAQPWIEGDTESRLLRSRLAIARSPALRGQSAVVLTRWRDEIARAMEARAVPPARARVIAVAAAAVLDDCMDRWAAGGGREPLFELIDDAFAALDAQ